MRRRILTGMAGLAMVMAIGVGPAAAADKTSLGTPGDKNCEGQTTAFLATNGGGIGTVADLNSLSVKEVKAIIRDFCNP